MRLADRVAIVTGAGSGIGAAAAAAMAREGARVIVADIDEAGAKATAGAIEKSGSHALAVAANVTRGADNEMLVERALAAWSRLDIFYANAGVPQAQGSIANLDEAVIDLVLAVNVKGVMLGAKYALPVMKKARRGVFLITASTAAIRPRGGHVYAASKGAVVTLTVPLGRLNQPDDIARVAVFLASDDAAMITGSCIEVDGGRCI